MCAHVIIPVDKLGGNDYIPSAGPIKTVGARVVVSDTGPVWFAYTTVVALRLRGPRQTQGKGSD